MNIVNCYEKIYDYIKIFNQDTAKIGLSQIEFNKTQNSIYQNNYSDITFSFNKFKPTSAKNFFDIKA